MFKSESLPSILKLRTAKLWAGRAGVGPLCLSVALLALLSTASAQNFTMDASQFIPSQVDPGGTTALNITLVPLAGFSGTVALTCQVTSSPAVSNPPVCQVSPASVIPSASATATVTTTSTGSDATTPALYTMIITATGSSGPPLTLQRDMSVLAVSPQFTITVTTAVQPSSVHAGIGAQGVISVNPINGYSGVVTLSCGSVSPLVTIPPVCSFSNQQPVTVSAVPETSTITISTYGPVPTTGALAHARSFYALWLPLPMLALAGLGAAVGGKKSRTAWGLLAVFVVSGALLLMPACSNTGVRTSTPNGVTPKNTYTFTVVGVDANGNSSSNTGAAGGPSVTLTVD